MDNRVHTALSSYGSHNALLLLSVFPAQSAGHDESDGTVMRGEGAHHNGTDPETTLRFGRVRGGFWAVLVGALLVAISLPAVNLRHAAVSPIKARACIWPTSPRVGAPAQLVVVLADATDRAAVQGPWARVAVKWDMTTMSMGIRPLVVPGPPRLLDDAGVFTIPLRVDMAGPWWVRVTLRTPGRPVWQSALQFTVLSPLPGTGQPAAQRPAALLESCGADHV